MRQVSILRPWKSQISAPHPHRLASAGNTFSTSSRRSASLKSVWLSGSVFDTAWVASAAGAPVSVPIDWDELEDPDLRSDRWNIRTAFDRLAEHGDPLRPLIGLQQDLPDLR